MYPTAAAVASLNWPSRNHLSFEQPRKPQSSLGECSIYPLKSPTRFREDPEFEIETALREALANAIVHGCKQDPSQKIQLCVGCDQSRGMLIIVRNSGEGFDPTRIASPTMGQNIYATQGRGIFLINQLM